MKAIVSIILDINDEPDPDHNEWVSYDKYIEARQIAIAKLAKIATNFAHTGNLHEIRLFVENTTIMIAKNPKPRWETIVREDANNILTRNLGNIIDTVYNETDVSLYNDKIDMDVTNKINDKIKYTDNPIESLSILFQLEEKTANDMDNKNRIEIFKKLTSNCDYDDLLRYIITNAAKTMYERALENRIYGTLDAIQYNIDVSQIKEDLLNEVMDQDDDETMDATGLDPDDIADCVKHCEQIKEYDFENRVKREIESQIESIMNDEEDEDDDYT